MSDEPLDHLTVGSGIPNATHSNVTVEPEYGVSFRLQGHFRVQSRSRCVSDETQVSKSDFLISNFLISNFLS